jgi:triacylglycerol lipase
MRHHIYLIPGFFGFSNFGDLKYFAHVTEVLEGALRRRGLVVSVHYVRTLPTASVRRRTTRLLEVMAETAQGDGPIHLIGHSSGGLDARFFASAGATLSDQPFASELMTRVRSVVTVVTPHRGTPLAPFFNSLLGARVLEILSLATIYVLRYGKLPLGALVSLGGVLVRLDNSAGEDALDQVWNQLLGDFSPDRQKAIQEFFQEVRRDTSLTRELMPHNLDVFNATTRDVPEVRYGSVIARGKAPGFTSTLSAGLSGYAQASHALYAALYTLASRSPPDRVRQPNWEQRQAIKAFWGDEPDERANDGIVPTLSQVWGEVICAVNADHHDVIGHFEDPNHVPPHFDWLTSGSGFKRRDFEILWSSVADWLANGYAA